MMMKQTIGQGSFLVLAGALMLAGPATAQQEPAADTPVPADVTVTEPEAPDPKLTEAAAAFPTETIARLHGITQELEREHGPFAPQLGEQLSGLGLAYQQNGQHEEAAETLSRALQIKRVNDGLQDMGQLALLQEIIESNTAARNWEDLDRNYQLLLWLHRRNYEVGDERFLPIVDRMGRWKLQAYREKLLKQEPVETLHEANELFTDTLRLLEDKFGENDPRLIDTLYGKALTSYAVMTEEAARPLSDFGRGPAPTRYVARQVCQPVRTAQGVRTVCQTISTPVMDTSATLNQQYQKDMTVQQRLLAARDSLQRVVDIYEMHAELPRDQYARALVHLGDWHTLSNRPGSAIEIYRKAWNVLVGLENGEELARRMFERPASVPALRMAIPEVDQQISEEKKFVSVAFDVSKSGRARNVEFIEGAEAETGRRSAIRKLITQQKFRPRLENGEPVDTIGVKMRVPEAG